jgi:hypothetical protein
MVDIGASCIVTATGLVLVGRESFNRGVAEAEAAEAEETPRPVGARLGGMG